MIMHDVHVYVYHPSRTTNDEENHVIFEAKQTFLYSFQPACWDTLRDVKKKLQLKWWMATKNSKYGGWTLNSCVLNVLMFFSLLFWNFSDPNKDSFKLETKALSISLLIVRNVFCIDSKIEIIGRHLMSKVIDQITTIH